MKGICESFKSCSLLCPHKPVHECHGNCKLPCNGDDGCIENSKCIPVQEIKYECNNSGICSTECQYQHHFIGSWVCKDCEYFVEYDSIKHIVFCAHPKEDKVKAHCLNCSTPKGPYIYCEHLVEVGSEFDVTGETHACIWYTHKEDKVEEKQEYKPKQANISMMSMGQKINCSAFRSACKDWLTMGYNIAADIAFKDIMYVANHYNEGIQCLIDKGFIEKVKPKLDLKFELKEQSDMFTIECNDYNILSLYKDGRGIVRYHGVEIEGLQKENGLIKVSK